MHALRGGALHGRGDARRRAGGAFADTGSLPAFLQTQLVFPYTGGQAFVEALRERAGGRWELVDLPTARGRRSRTEQVMHPDKYVRAEAPQPVRLDVGGCSATAGAARPGRWGELQTREMLAAAGGGGSSDAAAGWGGDRYELWQRAAAGDCARRAATPTCSSMRWRGTRRATRRSSSASCASGRRTGSRTSRARRSPRRGGAVTLVLAPDDALARRVAASR